MSLSADYFNEISAYLGKCNSCYTFDEQYYAAAPFSLYFYEETFGSVKSTTMYTYFSSFGKVYFVGAEIGQGVVAGLCDCDKLLHLAIRDNDRDIFAVHRACVVLEKIDTLFEILDCLFVGVHEYQIVYGRHQLALLCSVAIFDECGFHRDETFDALAF